MVFFKFFIVGLCLLNVIVRSKHIMIWLFISSKGQNFMYNTGTMGSYIWMSATQKKKDLQQDMLEDHENKYRLSEEEGQKAKKRIPFAIQLRYFSWSNV